MFAWNRFAAVVVKEFVQVRRDRLTFAMMIGVPVMQLVLFGFAINMDPKGLPMAVVAAESSPFSRSLVRALENSGYFRVVAAARHGGRGRAQLMAEGDVQFVLHDAGGLLAEAAARRAPGGAGGGRRDRSRRDRQCARGAPAAELSRRSTAISPGRSPALRARPPRLRAARAPPLQPRGHHRSTTSFPGSWAWCSP